MAILKRKQTGSNQLVGTSLNVAVDSYDPNTSILVFSHSGGDGDIRRGFILGVKSSTTQLTFSRGATGGSGANPIIEWELLEFDGNASVQNISNSGNGDADTAITSVDLAKSYIVSSGTNTDQTTKTNITSATYEFLNSTTSRRGTGNTAGNPQWAYQVVENLGEGGTGSIQFFSLGFQQGTEWNQSINAVDLNRTLVIGSAEPNGTYSFGQTFTLTLNSTTNVIGRNFFTGAFWTVAGFVVEFSADTSVQRTALTHVQGSGFIQNFTVSSTNLKNSIPFLGSTHTESNSLGSNAAGANGTNSACMNHHLTSSTNLQVERQDSDFGSITFELQLIENDPAATAIIQVNDTTSTGTGTDGVTFNHTLGGNALRMLVLAVTTRGNNSTDTAVTATFDTVSMTLGVTNTSGAGFNVRETLFYMLEADLPAAGTYQVVVSTPLGTAQITIASIVSFNTVNQAAPDVSATNQGTSTINEILTEIVTVSEDSLLVDGAAGDSSGASSAEPGTGQTELSDIFSGGNTVHNMSFRPVGLAEDWPMEWDYNSNLNRFSHVIFALNVPVPIVDLAGQSDGVATAGAIIEIFTDVVGQSDGVATVTSALGVIRPVAGQSDGVATASGTVEILTDLVGQSDGVATVTEDLQITRSFVGQSDGVAIVTASLDGFVPITAQSDGVSAVTAEMLNKKFLDSDVDGVATVQGSLTRILGPLSAQSDGLATVTVQLTVAIPLTGETVEGVATVTGTVEVLTDLIAQSDGVTATIGTLELQFLAFGQSDGVATAGADLHVLRPVAGQSDGVATVGGNLDGQLHIVVGQSDGEATVSGFIRVATDLAGQTDGVAAVAADLFRQYEIESLVEGVATVQASLGKVKDIAGQSDGVAGITAVLTSLSDLQSNVDGVATVVGNLSGIESIAGQSDGVATVTAVLEAAKRLEALSEGVATVQALLDVVLLLDANSDGVATAVAELDIKLVLDTLTIVGRAEVFSDLTNFVLPIGQSDGIATVDADLSIDTELITTSDGTSDVTGDIQLDVPLFGSSDGLSIPEGLLSIDGLGLGPVSSRGRTRVGGGLSVIRLDSSFAEKDDPFIETRVIQL